MAKTWKFCSINVANPARDIGGVAVPRIDNRISIGSEARLAGRKLFETAEREPRLITIFSRITGERR